jgi:hypothetical protein
LHSGFFAAADNAKEETFDVLAEASESDFAFIFSENRQTATFAEFAGSSWLEFRGVKDRPEMHEPSQKNYPQAQRRTN